MSKVPEENFEMRGRNQVKRNAKQNSFEMMSPQPESKPVQPLQNKSEISNYESKGRASNLQNSEEAKIEEINRNRDKLNSSINEIKDNYEELQAA
jgi:hypothetical protein